MSARELLVPNALGHHGIFAQAALLAVVGSGIALVSPAFVSEDMKSGRLIQLFDVMAKSGSKYFLAYSEPHRNTPRIRAFREWILGEAGTAR